jgi:acyl-CoA synthetase (AMP-forming)/AMP-acid ligase II
VSITVGPNFSLAMCTDTLRDDCAGLDLSTVKEVYCGAEPVGVDTLAQFEAAAATVGFSPDALIPCYGMAEATLFVSGKPRGTRYRTEALRQSGEDDHVFVSCGAVDSEHTVQIVDPATGVVLPDDSVGEIWLSGRSVAAGYHNREALTREVFRAQLADADRHYLRTGDLGFRRAGELFVTGRIKDLVVINARNIYPHDVEATVLRAAPTIRSAVAFSVAGEHTERLVVVAGSTHRTVSPTWHSTIVEAIRAEVTSEFGIGPDVYICPKSTIPTTTSGKVRRLETKRLFLSNGLRRIEIEAASAEVNGCPA